MTNSFMCLIAPEKHNISFGLNAVQLSLNIDLIPCEKIMENLSLMSVRVRVMAAILMVIIVQAPMDK